MENTLSFIEWKAALNAIYNLRTGLIKVYDNKRSMVIIRMDAIASVELSEKPTGDNYWKINMVDGREFWVYQNQDKMRFMRFKYLFGEYANYKAELGI